MTTAALERARKEGTAAGQLAALLSPRRREILFDLLRRMIAEDEAERRRVILVPGPERPQ